MSAGYAVREATAAVGDAIHAGRVPPDTGYGAIGSVAAWAYAVERDLEVSIGGELVGPLPSALYPIAGTPDELAAYDRVLRDCGIAPPWRCPDCAVMPGALHEDGCDVSRCAGCGRQALGCDEPLHAHTQIWTGRWPGSAEVEDGLARDLNHLAMCAFGPEPILLWDPATQRFARP